jgi:hypothetical protein
MTQVANETELSTFFNFMLLGVSKQALNGALDTDQFTAVAQILLDKDERAKNLLDYVAKGCPPICSTEESLIAAVEKHEEPYDGSAFFKNRPGIYVDATLGRHLNFEGHTLLDTIPQGRILERDTAETDVYGEPGSEKYATTLKNAVDLGQIERMIKAQWGGKTGPLLNISNIFPVVGKCGTLHIVRVVWYNAGPRKPGSQWRIFREKYVPGDVWQAGRQVFSN